VIIKSLTLKNFRNHASTQINLAPTLNILVGDNAAGKTNLLESIYLTCVGRGARTRKDTELIKFGSPRARVQTLAQTRHGDITIDIQIPAQGKKQIKINGTPIAKMGELLGTINCVYFAPDELSLIKDAPDARRRFMDISISQLDKNYFYSLLRYQKILRQRNSYLKSLSPQQCAKETHPNPFAELDIWDTQLIKEAQYIITRRQSFLHALAPLAESAHTNLTASSESLTLSYETSPLDLAASRANDLRLKTTTTGPHRDDIKIFVNDLDIRSFGSQGQQRTVALSMKLAELELFRAETGETPILLLDDVFSELDEHRQQRLIDVLKNFQTIITTTEQKIVPRGTFRAPLETIVFKIKSGRLLP
jgi:DNA replication and repair protein RecF